MRKSLTITKDISIRDAMKQLDLTAGKVLLVVNDDNKLLGALSDGDVRRAILSGSSINDSVDGIFNKKPIYMLQTEYNEASAKHILIEKKIALIPIVDNDMRIINFVTWDSVFSEHGKENVFDGEPVDIPVVIMAGGKGTRMEPFTRVLPKPLIPIGEKTIVELIIDQFSFFGINDFYFTINYKGDMIKAYFNSIDHPYNIKFVREDDYYGTAGSLKLIEKEISETFILSNCDILVKADYSEVLKFHRRNESELTILSAIYHHQIPYGVIKFGKNGAVTEMLEKPERTSVINTGIYIINQSCLGLIPEKEVFHVTHLINKLIDMKRNVFTYPVNASDYIDIGQWEEYRKAIKLLTIN